MTVEENLDMGSLRGDARTRRERDQGAWSSGSSRGCGSGRRQPAGLLSGGEQQMVAIGRGLMALPKLLMFDEPSLGLAPILVREIFNIIDRIRQQGTTVLIVEQNVKQTLADRRPRLCARKRQGGHAGNAARRSERRACEDGVPGSLIREATGKR